MGKTFLEHMGGRRLFSCCRCNTFITNRDNLVSMNFHGSTGRAYLFKKAVNVTYGKVAVKKLTTGKHWVKDVRCKLCNTKLGWFYELAVSPDQEYKEGMVVLERALVNDSDGIPEEVEGLIVRNRDIRNN